MFYNVVVKAGDMLCIPTMLRPHVSSFMLRDKLK